MTRRPRADPLDRLRAEWLATALEPESPERAVALAAIEQAARALKILNNPPKGSA